MSRFIKIIIIIVTILIIVGVGYFLATKYIFNKLTPSGNLNSTPVQTSSPTVAQQNSPSLGSLNMFGDSVLGITFTQDGKTIYYSPKVGEISTAGADGKSSSLVSGRIFENILNAMISAKNPEAILESNNNNNIAYSYFNWQKNALTNLDQNIKSLAWSPDYSQIAYLLNDPQTQQLVLYTAKPNGSAAKKISAIGMQDVIILWPQKNTIIIQEKSSALYNGSLFALSLISKNIQPLVSNIPGLMSQWSPDGSRALISDSSGNLVLIDNNGKILFNNFAVHTLAQKCAFIDNANIICAVPNNIGQSTLPDDWLKNKDVFSDSLVKINTTKGSIAVIDSDNFYFDAQNLTINASQKALYFLNKHDGKTYYTQL